MPEFRHRLLIAALALGAAAISPAPAAFADDDGVSGGGGFRAGKILRVAPSILRGLPGLSPRRYRKQRSARRSRAVARNPRLREREVVATGLTDDDIERLKAMGFVQLGQRELPTFGTSLTRLRIPADKSVSSAVTAVHRAAPAATASENVKYGAPSRRVYATAGSVCGARCEAFELISWSGDAGRCSSGARIGVVDTAADLAHASLAGANIESRVLRSADRAPSDNLHGTAVLSLLAGKPDSDVVGVAHDAQVLHADAFHGEGENARTDVFDLVAAIDWLVHSKVDVVNLSLSGPDNPIVKRAILAAQNQGVHVVAAAGKPVLNRQSGYPARYQGVIAVGAVDSRLRPSRLSLRGDHLAFTAPGVGLTVAYGKDDVRQVDGTSFATPFVAAAFAMSRARGVPVSDLARTAQDLGAKGRDPVFGWGLVRYSGIPQC